MATNDQLLLPVNPIFLWATLLAALAVNVVPLGREVWRPDVLAVALAVWNVHQPRRVGLGVAFLLGLVMDVHQGALLGQYALAYTTLTYLAIAIHRRLLWFAPLSQAVQVLPVFFVAHLVAALIRMTIGGTFPGWELALAPVAEAMLWPVIRWVLLAPQRRPPDADEHRPL